SAVFMAGPLEFLFPLNEQWIGFFDPSPLRHRTFTRKSGAAPCPLRAVAPPRGVAAAVVVRVAGQLPQGATTEARDRRLREFASGECAPPPTRIFCHRPIHSCRLQHGAICVWPHMMKQIGDRSRLPQPSAAVVEIRREARRRGEPPASPSRCL